MSTLEKIDDKNFVIKYKGQFYGIVSFNHLFCNWCLRFIDVSGTWFKVELQCFLNKSNLWKVNAEVTFKFIKSDGTEGYTETIDVVYQHDQFQGCCGTSLVKSDYVNENKYSIDFYVKIKSVIGFPYKMHDFTKSDNIINTTVLIVEDKKLYVSKMILANASPVFHAMFFSGFKESTDDEIPIEDLKYDEFEQFLQLTYGCHAVINNKNVDSLLQLADCFDVQIVRKDCEDYLLQNLECNTNESNLIRSEKYSLARLQDKVVTSLEKSQLKSFCSDSGKFGEATIRALAKQAASILH